MNQAGENPYAAQATPDSATGKSVSVAALVQVTAFFALLSAVAMYCVVADTVPRQSIAIEVLFFWCPPIAGLIVVSAMAARPRGAVSLFRHGVVTLAVAAAGYVAFVTVCSTVTVTSMPIIHTPPETPVHWSHGLRSIAVRAGLATCVATVVGCAIVAAFHRKAAR